MRTSFISTSQKSDSDEINNKPGANNGISQSCAKGYINNITSTYLSNLATSRTVCSTSNHVKISTLNVI